MEEAVKRSQEPGKTGFYFTHPKTETHDDKT